MKKMMITLAMIITLTTAAFAGGDKVRTQVLSAFKSKFSGAQNVTWTMGSDYYRVRFSYKGMHLSAFYDESAELLGVTRYISSIQLPYHLQSSLGKHLTKNWIIDLFEMSNDQSFGYYITLQNGDHKIVLESRDGSNWKEYNQTEMIRSF